MSSISVLSPLVTAISEQSGCTNYLIGQGKSRVLVLLSSHVESHSMLHKYLQVTGISITKTLNLTNDLTKSPESISTNNSIDLISYRTCLVLTDENSVFANANENVETLIQAALLNKAATVRFYFDQNIPYKTVALNDFVVSNPMEASL